MYEDGRYLGRYMSKMDGDSDYGRHMTNMVLLFDCTAHAGKAT